MPYFQLKNIYWEYQISAAKIFKSHLDSNKRYTLVLPELKGTSYPNETFVQTIANAKAADAEYFIIGYLDADNDIMVVSMVMYNLIDTSIIWNDHLIARTSYDLDPVLKLFADNIGSVKKASEEGKIYSLTYYNPEELNKVDATINFGVSLSWAYSMIDRVEKKTSLGIGLLVSYDSKQFIFDIQGEGLLGDLENYERGNIIIYDIRISGLFPLKTTKTTPFIGGSIAFGGVTFYYPNPNPKSYFTDERADGMGLSMFANAGYLFNRHSKVNFRLSGSYVFPFYETKTYPFYIEETQRPVGFRVNAVFVF